MAAFRTSSSPELSAPPSDRRSPHRARSPGRLPPPPPLAARPTEPVVAALLCSSNRAAEACRVPTTRVTAPSTPAPSRRNLSRRRSPRRSPFRRHHPPVSGRADAASGAAHCPTVRCRQRRYAAILVKLRRDRELSSSPSFRLQSTPSPPSSESPVVRSCHRVRTPVAPLPFLGETRAAAAGEASSPLPSSPGHRKMDLPRSPLPRGAVVRTFRRRWRSPAGWRPRRGCLALPWRAAEAAARACWAAKPGKACQSAGPRRTSWPASHQAV
jgi:hypothetical protein